jgi:drug/metabolite transporter (DMT)-like permease
MAFGRSRFLRLHPEPFVAAVLWGGVFTAAKVGLQHVPTLSFTTVRMLIAGGLLLLLSSSLGWHGVFRGLRRPLVIAGLAQTVFQILLLYGIQQTSVSASAILLATAPLLTAAWLAFRREEHLVRQQWLGILLGLAGVAIVMQSGGFGAGTATVIGNVFALGSAAAWAWYGLAMRPVVAALGPIRATTATIVFAAIVFVPLATPEMIGVDWKLVPADAWIGLLYGATLGLVVATALWVRSLGRWGTQVTMNYGYVEPVAAVLIAALLLNESMDARQAVGAVAALAGVWLASTPPARSAAAVRTHSPETPEGDLPARRSEST